MNDAAHGDDYRAVEHCPLDGRRKQLWMHRQAVSDLALEVVMAHAGVAMTIREIYEEVLDRLEVVLQESDVRESLRELARADDRCVKAGREAYAWAPDGVVPPPPAPPHVVEMIQRRWRGETLDGIGTAFGVTRERVRQLLKQYGGPNSAEVRAVQLEQAERAERARRDGIENQIRRVLSNQGAMTADDVAVETSLDASDVWRSWPSDLVHLRLWGFGRYDSLWSDDEIFQVIREAATYEFPLTTSAYAELLAVGQVKGPSLPRIGQRFGSWSAACDAAGVMSGQAMRPHYDSQWTDEDILSIVRRYLEDPGAPNSIQGYDVWRRSNAPDGPSGQTVRNRFRSWTAVKRMALAHRPMTQEGTAHE